MLSNVVLIFTLKQSQKTYLPPIVHPDALRAGLVGGLGEDGIHIGQEREAVRVGSSR